MYTTTVTLSDTTPQTLTLGATYQHMVAARESGSSTGTVTIELGLPGAAATSALATGSNQLDLTAGTLIYDLASTYSLAFDKVKLTPASLTGTVVVRIVAWHPARE